MYILNSWPRGTAPPATHWRLKMTNFAFAHIASWKQGQIEPKLPTENVVVVDYDQTKRAYNIEPAEMPAFIEWVAAEWEEDCDPREFNEDGDYAETAQEYLDRIWCTVTTR